MFAASLGEDWISRIPGFSPSRPAGGMLLNPKLGHGRASTRKTLVAKVLQVDASRCKDPNRGKVTWMRRWLTTKRKREKPRQGCRQLEEDTCLPSGPVPACPPGYTKDLQPKASSTRTRSLSLEKQVSPEALALLRSASSYMLRGHSF